MNIQCTQIMLVQVFARRYVVMIYIYIFFHLVDWNFTSTKSKFDPVEHLIVVGESFNKNFLYLVGLIIYISSLIITNYLST